MRKLIILLLVSLIFITCSKDRSTPAFRGIKWLSSPKEVIKSENVKLNFDNSNDKICPIVLAGSYLGDSILYGFQNNKLVTAGYIFSPGYFFHWKDLDNDSQVVMRMNNFIEIDAELANKYGQPDSIAFYDSATTFINKPCRKIKRTSYRRIKSVSIIHTEMQCCFGGWHRLFYNSKWYRPIEKY